MDTIPTLGIICLVYSDMLITYYHFNKKRKRKTSKLMLDGMKSMKQGNLDKALIYFDKAYECSIKTDDKEEMADALYNIGHIYKENGEAYSAMEYFNNALDIYKKLQNDEGSKKATLAINSIKESRNYRIIKAVKRQ